MMGIALRDLSFGLTFCFYIEDHAGGKASGVL